MQVWISTGKMYGEVAVKFVYNLQTFPDFVIPNTCYSWHATFQPFIRSFESVNLRGSIYMQPKANFYFIPYLFSCD